MLYPLMPDPETVVIAALAAQPSVAAIVAARVASRIPDAPVYPLIRVVRIGGGPDTPVSEHAVVQVECWAADDATASLLARTVIACHTNMRGTVAGGWLALTDPTTVLPVPDPVSEKARYIIGFDLEIGS